MNGLSTAGWANMAALLACGAAAGFAAIRQRRAGQGGRFWQGVALLMLALAGYRFLNLEHVLTDLARDQARAEHVYNARRLPQAILVSVGLLAGVGAQLLILRLRWPAAQRLALSVLLALLGLYALRLLSLHMTDSLLYASVGGVHLNWAIEGLLLATLAATAATAAAPRRRCPPPRRERRR